MVITEDLAPAPWRIPSFRALWLGGIFFGAGAQFYGMTLTWLILELTGSSLQLGVVFAVTAVPHALMMLLNGAIIDRSKPRRLLVWSALGNGIAVALVALFFTLNWLTLTILMVAGSIMGLAGAFFYPTSFAVIPRIVHRSRFAQANALTQAAEALTSMVLPALTGLVIGYLGIPAALTMNAALFLIGAFLMYGVGRVRSLDLTEDPGSVRESNVQALLSGLRYALFHPPIRLGVFVTAALTFAATGPVVVGGAVLVQQRFGGDVELYGVFLTAFGVGALVGTLIAPLVSSFAARPGWVLIWTALMLGLTLIGIGLSPSFWIAFAMLLFAGIINGMCLPLTSAWIQQETPLTMQGRIASLFAFAGATVDPASQGLAGALSEIDVTVTFVAAGTLLLLVAVGIAWSPTAHVRYAQPAEHNP